MTGWRIGKISGISIEINSSWLLIFALFFYELGSHVFPGLARGEPVWASWLAAFCATILFFASVVVHELAHSFVARRVGIEVKRITLFVFGGVAQVEEEPKQATDELLIALAGPGMSVALSLAFGGLYWLTARLGGPRLIIACAQCVAIANLALAIFNMVPGFPMDGGRVLRSLLWYYWGDLLRATRVASIMGQLVGYALIALGIYTGLSSGNVLSGVWHILLGLLLATVARQAYRREVVQASLARMPIGQLAIPPDLVFPTGTPLSVAAAYYDGRPPQSWTPIVHAAQPVGVLLPDRALTIPRSQWPTILVEQVMEPLREELLIRHSRPADEALSRMAAGGARKLMVLDDRGNLQGIVTDAGLAAAVAHTR